MGAYSALEMIKHIPSRFALHAFKLYIFKISLNYF